MSTTPDRQDGTTLHLKRVSEETTKGKRNRGPQPLTTSFHADPDVKKMLKRVKALGGNVSEIVNAALREHGPRVLKNYADDLRKQADEVCKEADEFKKSAPNPAK